MRKYLGVMLIFALLFVVAFSSGMVAAAQQKTLLLEQEIALLRDHNGRLIKSLALSEARQADALTMAHNGETDKEQLFLAMSEASNWLWMAEEALNELDRVVREGDPEADIPVIIKDIRDVIAEANSALGQALGTDMAQIIVEESEAFGIDPWLLTAMAYRESCFDPSARGWSGEYGLLQIMPKTGEWVAGKLGYQDYDLLDLRTNVKFAAYYLSAVTKDTAKHAPGKETIAGVLAYNRGPTGARKWLQSGKAPEDHQYVQRVMETYERLKRGVGVEHIYPLPGEEDDRTPEQQARDLGILPDMPDKLIITGVKWICNEQGRRGDHDVRVGSYSISFSRRAYKWFGSAHIVLSVGKAKGTPVLIVKPTRVHDKRSYKINTKPDRPSIVNHKLVQRLLAAGLVKGNYELRRYKDLLVAVPVNANG